jgi:acyl dehydratase
LESKLDRSYIGKEYFSDVQIATEESMIEYAKATNETNPIYFDTNTPGGLMHTPLYPVVFIQKVIDQLAAEAEDMNLDLLRVVHAEQEMLWKGTILPGSNIVSTAKIMDMQHRGPHEILDLQIQCKSNEILLVEMKYRLLIRGERKGEKQSSTPDEPVSSGAKIAERTIQVSSDQGKRYAEASGDHNPIHIDNDVARFVGLPGCILHGLCTMAFAAQTIVDEVLDGDPTRLQYMKVRFSKPVLIGDTVTTIVFDSGVNDEGQHEVSFESKNSAGDLVIKNGEARFKP